MSSDSDSCLGRLAFRVLGPVEVRAGDKVVDLGRPRFRAVLAYLLTHPNRIVSTDQLIEALWGGATPSTARAQIQASISMLRRALSAYGAQDIIGTHSPGYLIRIGSGQLDLEVFTEDMSSARQAAAAGQLEVAAATLRRALSRWSGPALANVTGAYVEQTRACLEERRLAALEKLADVELAMGRHAEVVTQLSALVSADPLRESLAGRLMLALYRCGRRSDALQVARQVRRILVEREGLDPGRELAALESSILQSDATLDWTPPREHQPADVPTREGLARPRASAPNWLPPVVADFTGREAALRWLDSLHGTDTGTSRVAIITGSAGVGKTALAVHWARLRADAFADGQFYVNLRGSSTLRRVRPVEVVSTLLRELGVAADQIPVDLDEASALYRRLLADRRALVLLDDAVVAEQVRPLLPTGSTNVLLVTSRKGLGGLLARDGASRLDLGVLRRDEAMSLLGKLLGMDRMGDELAPVARLARACAYLPLALRIVAANLADGRYASITALVDDLHGGGWPAALEVHDDPEATVRAAFDLSYASLADATQLLFRRLGLVPGPDFTSVEAAILAETTVEQAEVHLARLVDAHLIDRPASGRYGFHDLLRRYAAETARVTESASIGACMDRLYGSYLSTAYRAGQLVFPELLRLPLPGSASAASERVFTDAVDALEWLDAQRANLVAAIHQAARQGLRPIAWLLNDALRGYFAIRRHTAEWAETAQAALTAAEAVGDLRARVAASVSVAQCDWWCGRYETAVRRFSSARGLAERADWAEAVAGCLNNLGATYGEWGRLDDAVRCLTEAVAINRELRPGSAMVATNLVNLGYYCYQLGQLAEAAEHYSGALTTDRAAGAQIGEAYVRVGLGLVRLAFGEPSAAASDLRVALELFSRHGDLRGEADALAELARLHLTAGVTDAAASYAGQALTVARKAGYARGEASALNTLATIERDPNLHEEALRIARVARARYAEADVLLGLAGTFSGLGQGVEGITNAQQALDLARQAGFRGMEAHALLVLAEIHTTQGLVRQARDFAAAALRVSRATGHKTIAERAGRLLGQTGQAPPGQLLPAVSTRAAVPNHGDSDRAGDR